METENQLEYNLILACRKYLHNTIQKKVKYEEDVERKKRIEYLNKMILDFFEERIAANKFALDTFFKNSPNHSDALKLRGQLNESKFICLCMQEILKKLNY